MRFTIAEWAKRQKNDVVTGIIEEAVKSVPEFAVLPFRTIVGTDFKIYRRTGLPSGEFRQINDGIDPSSSQGQQVEVKCSFFDSRIEIDEAMLMGDDGTLGDMLSEEGVALALGNFIKNSEQIWYGSRASNGGFDGVSQALLEEMTVSATDGNPSEFTSVYMTYSGVKGVEIIGGNNTGLELGDVRRGVLVTGANGKQFEATVQSMKGWYGFKVGNTKSVGKLTNITDALTQEKMAELLFRFPAHCRPTEIFMNRRAYALWLKEKATVGILRQGNTRLTINGDYGTVSVDEFMGIPVYVTDAIKENEGAVA